MQTARALSPALLVALVLVAALVVGCHAWDTGHRRHPRSNSFLRTRLHSLFPPLPSSSSALGGKERLSPAFDSDWSGNDGEAETPPALLQEKTRVGAAVTGYVIIAPPKQKDKCESSIVKKPIRSRRKDITDNDPALIAPVSPQPEWSRWKVLASREKKDQRPFPSETRKFSGLYELGYGSCAFEKYLTPVYLGKAERADGLAGRLQSHRTSANWYFRATSGLSASKSHSSNGGGKIAKALMALHRGDFPAARVDQDLKDKTIRKDPKKDWRAHKVLYRYQLITSYNFTTAVPEEAHPKSYPPTVQVFGSKKAPQDLIEDGVLEKCNFVCNSAKNGARRSICNMANSMNGHTHENDTFSTCMDGDTFTKEITVAGKQVRISLGHTWTLLGYFRGSTWNATTFSSLPHANHPGVYLLGIGPAPSTSGPNAPIVPVYFGTAATIHKRLYAHAKAGNLEQAADIDMRKFLRWSAAKQRRRNTRRFFSAGQKVTRFRSIYARWLPLLKYPSPPAFANNNITKPIWTSPGKYDPDNLPSTSEWTILCKRGIDYDCNTKSQPPSHTTLTGICYYSKSCDPAGVSGGSTGTTFLEESAAVHRSAVGAGLDKKKKQPILSHVGLDGFCVLREFGTNEGGKPKKTRKKGGVLNAIKSLEFNGAFWIGTDFDRIADTIKSSLSQFTDLVAEIQQLFNSNIKEIVAKVRALLKTKLGVPSVDLPAAADPELEGLDLDVSTKGAAFSADSVKEYVDNQITSLAAGESLPDMVKKVVVTVRGPFNKLLSLFGPMPATLRAVIGMVTPRIELKGSLQLGLEPDFIMKRRKAKKTRKLSRHADADDPRRRRNKKPGKGAGGGKPRTSSPEMDADKQKKPKPKSPNKSPPPKKAPAPDVPKGKVARSGLRRAGLVGAAAECAFTMVAEDGTVVDCAKNAIMWDELNAVGTWMGESAGAVYTYFTSDSVDMTAVVQERLEKVREMLVNRKRLAVVLQRAQEVGEIKTGERPVQVLSGNLRRKYGNLDPNDPRAEFSPFETDTPFCVYASSVDGQKFRWQQACDPGPKPWLRLLYRRTHGDNMLCSWYPFIQFEDSAESVREAFIKVCAELIDVPEASIATVQEIHLTKSREADADRAAHPMKYDLCINARKEGYLRYESDSLRDEVTRYCTERAYPVKFRKYARGQLVFDSTEWSEPFSPQKSSALCYSIHNMKFASVELQYKAESACVDRGYFVLGEKGLSEIKDIVDGKTPFTELMWKYTNRETIRFRGSLDPCSKKGVNMAFASEELGKEVKMFCARKGYLKDGTAPPADPSRVIPQIPIREKNCVGNAGWCVKEAECKAISTGEEAPFRMYGLCIRRPGKVCCAVRPDLSVSAVALGAPYTVMKKNLALWRGPALSSLTAGRLNLSETVTSVQEIPVLAKSEQYTFMWVQRTGGERGWVNVEKVKIAVDEGNNVPPTVELDNTECQAVSGWCVPRLQCSVGMDLPATSASSDMVRYTHPCVSGDQVCCTYTDDALSRKAQGKQFKVNQGGVTYWHGPSFRSKRIGKSKQDEVLTSVFEPTKVVKDGNFDLAWMQTASGDKVWIKNSKLRPASDLSQAECKAQNGWCVSETVCTGVKASLSTTSTNSRSIFEAVSSCGDEVCCALASDLQANSPALGPTMVIDNRGRRLYSGPTTAAKWMASTAAGQTVRSVTLTLTTVKHNKKVFAWIQLEDGSRVWILRQHLKQGPVSSTVDKILNPAGQSASTPQQLSAKQKACKEKSGWCVATATCELQASLSATSNEPERLFEDKGSCDGRQVCCITASRPFSSPAVGNKFTIAGKAHKLYEGPSASSPVIAESTSLEIVQSVTLVLTEVEEAGTVWAWIQLPSDQRAWIDKKVLVPK